MKLKRNNYNMMSEIIWIVYNFIFLFDYSNNYYGLNNIINIIWKNYQFLTFYLKIIF